jgi:hypothetical protein
LLCGRIAAVTVRVVQRTIPTGVLGSDPIGDKPYRQRISAWVEHQWVEKDLLIDELLIGAGRNPDKSQANHDRAAGPA